MEKIVGQTAITEVLKLVKQKDSELQNNIDINSTAIGTISELDTTDKSNLVNAINELNTEVDTNTANIATNTDNILANTNNIAANTSSISNINNQITTINNTLSRKADSSSLSPVATSGDYNDLINTPTIPTVNDGILTIQRNSTTIDTFSANSSTDKTINISVPTAVTDLTDGANYSLITETGNKITLSIDSTTYELTAKLYDKNNTLINTSNAIDLPLESAIVNVSYDNTTKDLTFTLQNGTTLTVPLDDMISGLASQSDLDALELRVQTNENNISTNTSDISGLSSDVQTNTSNINTLQTNQGALSNLNTTNKSSLVNAINEVNTQVETNTSAISTNTSDISNLDSRLTTAEGNISTNATNITNLGTSKQDKLVAGTGISIDPVTNVIDGTVYTLPAATSSTLGGIKVGANLNITGDGTLSAIAQPITIDNVLSTTSENPVQNKIIKNKIDSMDADIASKQDTLVSGTNIKTINNQSILGSGNISISSGTDLPIVMIKSIVTALPATTDYSEGDKVNLVTDDGTTYTNLIYTLVSGVWTNPELLDASKYYFLENNCYDSNYSMKYIRGLYSINSNGYIWDKVGDFANLLTSYVYFDEVISGTYLMLDTDGSGCSVGYPTGRNNYTFINCPGFSTISIYKQDESALTVGDCFLVRSADNKTILGTCKTATTNNKTWTIKNYYSALQIRKSTDATVANMTQIFKDAVGSTSKTMLWILDNTFTLTYTEAGTSASKTFTFDKGDMVVGNASDCISGDPMTIYKIDGRVFRVTNLTSAGTYYLITEMLPDLSNYLAKDNTTAFTPTGDYQPATKKYVDDNAGGGGDTVPIGLISPYPASTAPHGWLLCDGSAVSRTTYKELFEIIGTSHGSGDGSTTFNLPNMPGYTPVGVDANDSNLNAAGKTYGSKTVTLTQDQIPYHEHYFNNGAGAYVNPTVDRGSNTTWGASYITSNDYKINSATGQKQSGNYGQAHNNMQPSIAEYFMIKAFKVSVPGHDLGDTLPIGSVIDYDGDTVPDGYEEVTDFTYSTSEYYTGRRWVDNKKIYGKVLHLTNIQRGYQQYAHGISNFGRLVNLWGSIYLGPTYQYQPIFRVVSDNTTGEAFGIVNVTSTYIHTLAGTTMNTTNDAYITIEYTKSN